MQNIKSLLYLIVKRPPFRAGDPGTAPINYQDADITCYADEVPSFIQSEFARLYGNLLSSFAHLDIYNSLLKASTYVVRKNNEIICALAFEHKKDEVSVINEGMRIDQEEIGRFARYIFSSRPSVNKIEFRAIATEVGQSSFVVKHFPFTENIILTLPSTEEEYAVKLGKSTRKNIRHYLNRATRQFPSFKHEIVEGKDAGVEDILAIIDFNKLRMAEKNKQSAIDDMECGRIIQMVKRCGFISIIKIDDRICAGAICYSIGPNVTSRVNAHDPRYDDLRLGTLACYLTICACIKRQMKEFHFLWGRYEYKFALLGVQQNLDRVFVYRTRMHAVLDGKTLLQQELARRKQTLKSWLTEEIKKGNPLAVNLKKAVQRAKR